MSHVLLAPPLWWPTLLASFFTAHFAEFGRQSHSKLPDNPLAVDDGAPAAEEAMNDEEADPSMIGVDLSYSATAGRLVSLGWQLILEPHYSAVVYAAIEQRIQERCASQYKTPLVSAALEWVDHVPLSWITTFGADRSSWSNRLHSFVRQRMATLRTKELFDIIRDYPETQPALLDLKLCLQLAEDGDRGGVGNSSAGDVVRSLSAAIGKRLLQAGANTGDIITQYINTIKALRDLDHTGVMLQGVGEPIRRYDGIKLL